MPTNGHRLGSAAAKSKFALVPTRRWAIELSSGDWYEGDGFLDLVAGWLGTAYVDANAPTRRQWRAAQAEALTIRSAASDAEDSAPPAIVIDDPAGRDHERAFLESLARCRFLTIYENLDAVPAAGGCR